MAEPAANGLDPHDQDEAHMHLALEQARAAANWGDVPIGAVIIRKGQVIAAAGNRKGDRCRPHGPRRTPGDSSGGRVDRGLAADGLHALRDFRAVHHVRRSDHPGPTAARGVWSNGPEGRPAGSVYSVLLENKLNHQPQITASILAEPCGHILTDFFRAGASWGRNNGGRHHCLVGGNVLDDFRYITLLFAAFNVPCQIGHRDESLEPILIIHDRYAADLPLAIGFPLLSDPYRDGRSAGPAHDVPNRRLVALALGDDAAADISIGDNAFQTAHLIEHRYRADVVLGHHP